MSLVDIAIVAVLLISLLMGMFRGLVREVLALFSWLAALWVAYRYAVPGAEYLEPYLDQPQLRVVAAFALIFVVVLIVMSMISYLLSRLFSATGITGVDRSLGTLFGLVRGIVIVALLILGATFVDFTTQPWWKESLLVHHFDPATEFIKSLLPEDVAQHIPTNVI